VTLKADNLAAALPAAGSPARERYRWAVLFGLTAVFTLNYADRQLLAVLAEPIKQELSLTDTKLGLLTGSVFGLFYTLVGLPVAWVADRTSRVRIVSIGCAVWSVLTAFCGMTHSLIQLAIARSGVAIGEAGGTAPSFSIISDYFGSRNRGRALALFTLGVPIGITCGVAYGAWIGKLWGWRAAFVSLGIPGLIVALLIPALIREPTRGSSDSRDSGSPSTLWATFKLIFRSRMMIFTIAGSCCAATTQTGIMAWMPAFLMRVQGATLAQVGSAYSLFTGAASISGALLTGFLLDRLLPRTAKAYNLIPATALALAFPLFLAAVFAPGPYLCIVLIALVQMLLMSYQVPAFAAVHSLVPPAQRSTASAALLFIFGITSMGIGPLLVGFISDTMHTRLGVGSLRWGLVALSPFFCASATILFAGSRASQHDPGFSQKLRSSLSSGS
jgi:predicted MFS family arabinose efflux permease